MLITLHVKNFITIKETQLDFKNHLTVITGETGAGKSILLRAISLAIGGGFSTEMLHDKSKSCEVTIAFDISQLHEAKNNLSEQELVDEDEDECIIRRIISPQGRSKYYINGKLVSATQIKQIASKLITIYSQHQNLNLIKSEYQLKLLDIFAGNTEKLKLLKEQFNIYKKLIKEQKILENNQNIEEKTNLIDFYLSELNKLDLKANEVAELSKTQQKLTLKNNVVEQVSYLNDNLQNLNLHNLSSQLQRFLPEYPELENCYKTLCSAAINVDESLSETNIFLNNLEISEEQLAQAESRLEEIYNISRKHKVLPNELYDKWQSLKLEYDSLLKIESQKAAITQEILATCEKYKSIAHKISESRAKAAKQLSVQITQMLASLNMSNCSCKVNINYNVEAPISELGLDDIEFKVSTNPDKPPTSLAKVASGGELSRISLAIESIIADYIVMPCIIFDEVDTGIGGQTASAVGKLLSKFSKNKQVICITHLPQVASFANTHLGVSKSINSKITTSQIIELDSKDRVKELARMLGSDKITKEALANAKIMLEEAHINT